MSPQVDAGDTVAGSGEQGGDEAVGARVSPMPGDNTTSGPCPATS